MMTVSINDPHDHDHDHDPDVDDTMSNAVTLAI